MQRTIFAAACLLLFTVAGPVVAQQTGTISGVVVDSTTTETIPGANIVVDDLDRGAATNADGEFMIQNVPTGSHTLVVSFIGYQTSRVPVEVNAGETTEVRVQLATVAVGLGEGLIVTALGIQREERSLGYAVQQVSGDDLSRVPETNFIGNLQGKVAGADISMSNAMGGSARIVLRGARSISGNNQPLIVVDGVPLDNSNFTSGAQARGTGGYDYGNAASMINPNNVQSISVLKGPNAAALYGSRAANGVIEVTTKGAQGVEGIGVEVNTGITLKEVYGLPDYQNEYGGGSWGPFGVNDQGQYVVDYGTDQSWGPRLDGRQVRQWYSYDDVNGLLGQTTPWEAHPNNVVDFFETGVNYNTSIAFQQNTDTYNYRLALNNNTEGGVYPNSSLERNQISFNGSVDLTDRLTSTVRANYVKTEAEGRPGTGYDGLNVFQQFNHFGQRQLDLSDGSYMRDYERPDGSQRGWNWIGDPTAGNLIYFDNPFWTRYNNFQNDDTDRVFGSVNIHYDVTDELSISGDARTDFYTERREERLSVGSVGQPEYSEAIRQVREYNFKAQLDYITELSEEFSLDAYAGADYRYNTYNRNIGNTAGGLSVPNVYTLENSISRPSIDDYFEQRGLIGVYATANVGYRDMLYLEGSMRNDWTSTLPEGENSYFYPSAKLSFVFTEIEGLSGDVLSFGRARLGWSQVGNDTAPYQLERFYSLSLPFRGNPIQSVPSQLNNPNLDPEITTSLEGGLELRFFNDRFGFDVSAYTDRSRNQILGVEVSRASGYGSLLLNAGEILNEGIELTVFGTPVQTQDLQWDLNINWSTNRNEVVELDEDLGLESYTIGTAPFGPQVVARVGEPYGTLFGPGYVYDDNGNIILNSSGVPRLSAPRALGKYTPDWTAGLQSTFNYRGVIASFVLNGQMGGRIYSVTNMFGMYSGLVEETVAGNVREVGVIPEGVYENEQGELVEWTDRVDPNLFFINGFFGNNEANIFDATYIKLQEISIGYQLPANWFVNSPVQSLRVMAIGRNLTTLYKRSPHFDPATALSAGNLQGIEAGQVPPSRSYGLSFNITL